MKALKHILVIAVSIPALAFAQQATSYDSDGDAVPDSVDKCLLVKGSSAFHGCPQDVRVTKDDKDGDGVADIDDKCAFMYGAKENGGCPDLGKLSESLKSETPNNYGIFDTKTTASSPLTTASSTKAIANDEFKEQLTQIISGTDNNFAKLTVEQRRDADAKATTCLKGAQECFVTAGKDVRYFAVLGNYSDIAYALQQFEKTKNDVRIALGEGEWTYTENMVPSRMAVYDAWQKAPQGETTSHVAVYVKKADNNTYNVYVVIERDACCYASNN